MKIAILSDIHGNVFALKSVLDAIAKKNVEIIIIAGDFVGYYFWPVEVFDLLKNYEIIAISGNHDKMLKKARTERGYLDKICKKYGSGLNIALENLDDISLSWLENLPDSFEFKTQYGNILICHGSPWDNNEYIYPDISNGLLGRYSNLNFKWVIHGHTHYPMYKEKGGTILINPGSVGQSRNGKPGAYWALLDTELGKPYFFCEKYDLQKVIDESKKRHPEIPYLANILEVVG
jgi:putative phosphoesterase